MFTGIISNLGKFKKRKGSVFVFETESDFIKKLEHGTSVSVNGACMTVTDIPNAESFSVDVMPESEKRTMFSSLEQNDLVNLELPATPETFLSGHIVQGHIDGTGEIVAIQDEGISKIVTIAVSNELEKYIVEKGSIAVNGISLTVIHVKDNKVFRVGIIPFTWEHTMLQQIRIGTKVNIETDVFARYVEKLVQRREE